MNTIVYIEHARFHWDLYLISIYKKIAFNWMREITKGKSPCAVRF